MDITIWRLPNRETTHILYTNTPTITYMTWERNQKKTFHHYSTLIHYNTKKSHNITENNIMDITIWRLPKLETTHILYTNTPTIKYMTWERNQRKYFIIIQCSYTVILKNDTRIPRIIIMDIRLRHQIQVGDTSHIM